jgi:hypothetical protein
VTSFEVSLEEIAGLTDYREGKLPEWFRKTFFFWGAEHNIQPMDDDKLVDRLYWIDPIGHWGSAMVDGEEVVVVECLGDDIDCVGGLAYHANCIECGFMVVEESESYQGSYITLITPHFCVTPRPRAAKVLAAAAY